MTATQVTIPDGFSVVESYRYQVRFRADSYSNKKTTLTLYIARDKQYYVESVHFTESFSNWGIFEREFAAETLEEMKAKVDTWVAIHEQGIADYLAREKKRRANFKAFDKAFAKWAGEQLRLVEMVPIEELVNHSGIRAVVVKGAVRTDYYCTRHYSRDYDGPQMFKLEVGDHWANPENNPIRYIKAGSKVRGIREFTRPMPTREDFGL